MRSYPVKKNHIGSAVSEILWYKQTDKRTSCYFIIRIESGHLDSPVKTRTDLGGNHTGLAIP